MQVKIVISDRDAEADEEADETISLRFLEEDEL